MRAVTCSGAGGVEVLEIGEVPNPAPQPGEVLIDVAATAVNRADLLQRRGFYPPPPGASDILGLECSGTVAALGEGVERWQVGEQVCALLAGGGYAEQAAAPAGQLLPIPDGIATSTRIPGDHERPPADALVIAGGLPEVACTVWSNVFMVAGLQRDETLLVHGGAGGIGTIAIQLAKALGARVCATAGSEEKLALCRELGADVAISYRDEDFVEVVRRETAGHGADVILDVMGAKYLDRNIDVLATNGRLVIIGMQGGVKAELNIGKLLGKRAAVTATSLRGRPVAEKAAIIDSVREYVWPLFEQGTILPIVHAVLPLDAVREGHQLLEDGGHAGKVLLTVTH